MAERDAAARSDVKQSIRMTADRLLVQPSKEAGERKSRSGILIPATANVDRRLVWTATPGAPGRAGGGLAARLAADGQRVFAGSRDPAKAEATVRQLVERWGPRMAHIEPASNAEVAEAAEIVVLGTTAKATVATAAEHAPRLAGKVVVSMANAMPRGGADFEPVRIQGGAAAPAVPESAP